MKASILLFIGILCIINVFAQSPQAFNYQAVVRNTSGNIIPDQNVSLRISLLQGSATGTPVFVETHTAATNTFGLVNLKIGNGTVVFGTFETLDWSAGPYFIEIEMDVTGGNTYIAMGVSQLLSVPYALYAASGNQGPQGIQGLPGTNGQNGISVIWLGTFIANPINPSINQAYYNSTDKKSYVFDGTGWQIIAQDGVDGIQGATGADGLNGISVSWLGSLPSNPVSPTLNQAYYNSTDKKSYIFDGFGWQIIAQDGMQGLQGIQGTQGLQGPAGTYIAGAGITISNDTISAINTSNSVGGINGNLQFNNNGILGGNNSLFWDNNNLWLGVGTSIPTSTLHINGTLRITDDNEGTGKILTSDTNGYASWQLPSNSAFTGTQNRIAKFTSANSLGNSLFYENGNYMGLGTTTPFGKLVVQGDSLSADSVPLFEVKDKSGNTVFVIWPTGAHFYIDSAGTAKTNNRGSFAISGKSNSKSITNEFFSVNSDSIKASKSLYIPRMTTAERDNLGFTPSEALIIFNTTDECMEIFKNGVWSNIWCFNCAPAIIQQAVNASICSNGDTSFSVSATGVDLTYQWQESSDGGNSWIDIVNGGTSPTYSNAATNVLSMSNIPAYFNTFLYRCVASGSCNPAATSNAVTLNISTSDLTVTTQPDNVILLAGCNTNFTIATSAYGQYQWQKSTDGGSTWSNISNGGTSPVFSETSSVSLSLSNIPLSYNSYLFRCVVTNLCGTGATSNNASLTVNSNILTATAATNITNNSFSANWNAVPDAASYFLDVSTVADFSSFVPGFNNLFVNNLTTYMVTGLSHNTNYYYRVRANNFCRNENSNTITVAPLPFVFGEIYGGGIIFYIDGSGQHGLIATQSDQSTNAQWGCYGTIISGADGTAIGTGSQNTIDIEAGCTTAGTAADIASNLVLDGYSDWFLPSKDELNQLFINRVAIGGFSNNYYWSSSEDTANYAWLQWFDSGTQFGYTKSNNIYVRCVRSF